MVDPAAVKRFNEEAESGMKLRHPNIVQLREVLASRTKIFIVLELVTGGELFDQIVKEGRFTEDKARKYFRQLINGISYCNSRGKLAKRSLRWHLVAFSPRITVAVLTILNFLFSPTLSLVPFSLSLLLLPPPFQESATAT